MSEPAVGADIESLCSKCGDVWHVVVAMVEDKVAKVQCKECNAEHRYKDPKGKKKPAPRKKAAKKTTTRRRTTKKTAEPELPVIQADMDKPVRDYRASEEFEPGQRINHVKFGEGIVQRSKGPGKIEVMFNSEPKLLACAKPAMTLVRAPRARVATEAE